MLSKRACDHVYSYFVNLKYGNRKDIWESNPLNAHMLDKNYVIERQNQFYKLFVELFIVMQIV